MYQSGLHAPPLTKVNKYFLGVLVALFLVSSLFNVSGLADLKSIFGLSALGISQGFIFQFLTYPFFEDSLLGLLFGGLIIWFLGGDLESRWGARSYIQFMAVSSIGAGIVFIIIALFFSVGDPIFYVPLLGVEGITFALLFAYGYLFPERQMIFMMLFPMKARYFCMLLGFIQLYLAIFSPYGKVAWAHISAMAIGIGYIKFRASSLSILNWNNYMKSRRKESMKKKLYVIKGKDEDDGPKYWQ